MGAVCVDKMIATFTQLSKNPFLFLPKWSYIICLAIIVWSRLAPTEMMQSLKFQFQPGLFAQLIGSYSVKRAVSLNRYRFCTVCVDRMITTFTQ